MLPWMIPSQDASQDATGKNPNGNRTPINSPVYFATSVGIYGTTIQGGPLPVRSRGFYNSTYMGEKAPVTY